MRTTRTDLHRLCAHVLGRRRYAVSGHFGLRASPDGLATPAFGLEPETLRLTPACLVREVGTESSSVSLQGATLEELARFADADLGSDYSTGANTPDLGSTTEPLHLPPDELTLIFDWFALGWRVLDTVGTELPDKWTHSTVQLWPEHFDAGTNVVFNRAGAGADADADGVTLGFSAGDSFSEEPYAYVGPWGPERPGDPGFWNAPFGALVTRAQAGDASACVAFLRTGLTRLAEV
jgi:hypothetical protein